MEEEEVWNCPGDSFSPFTFHFSKPLKFVWVDQNRKFVLGKSIFHSGKKWAKVTLPLVQNIPLTPCIEGLWYNWWSFWYTFYHTVCLRCKICYGFLFLHIYYCLLSSLALYVTQRQLMRLFAVKLIWSYEQKCKVTSKFVKN